MSYYKNLYNNLIVMGASPEIAAQANTEGKYYILKSILERKFNENEVPSLFAKPDLVAVQIIAQHGMNPTLINKLSTDAELQAFEILLDYHPKLKFHEHNPNPDAVQICFDLAKKFNSVEQTKELEIAIKNHGSENFFFTLEETHCIADTISNSGIIEDCFHAKDF